MATDTPERMIRVSCEDAELCLYDGRMLAQNGWFVLRSVLPRGKTGKVVTWTVEPHAIPNWIREPNIGFSQVGYQPEQPKVAVIELDKKDSPLSQATLMRLNEDGTTTAGSTSASTSDTLRAKLNFSPGLAVYLFPNVCATVSVGLGGLQYNSVKQRNAEGGVAGSRWNSQMRFRVNIADIRIGVNVHLWNNKKP
jgi:hypothetical protein